MYENLKILIIGAGKSGISVAKLLAGKNNIVLSDINPLDDTTKEELNSLGVEVVITENQLSLLNNTWDLVIKNPAIMYTSDIVKKINELGLRCENEMEVAYHFLPKDITIIGITGSNGKTTTTTIVYELLKRMHQNVVLGGNIGYALCEIINNIHSNDILLLEISDHQLCDFNDFKTHIGAITNICPTHLDYHGTYEHYMFTKGKIFNKHTNNDIAIINAENEDSLVVSKNIPSRKIYFNDDINYIRDGKIYVDNNEIINTNDIKLKGQHNYEDILMALLIVKQFAFDINVIRDFLKDFNGVEHRIEFVKEINGVEYYNDSKSTNPTATITALKTFNKPIHLILGGLERNQDFNELNDYLKNVKYIYAIGTITDRVYDYAKSVGIPCYSCYELKNAMQEIEKHVENGDIVLLSPGSSSQDQYKRFEDRGIEFKNIVEKFKI